jgi:HSP20 family protein
MAISPLDPFALSRWDPFHEMTTLRDAMNRLMESAFVSPTGLSSGETMPMPIDLSETDTEYTVHASLPGFKPEDVKVSVQNNVLTIEGERKYDREAKEGERNLISEHRYGKVSRSFSFATPVDADRAQANFEHGVLTLTLPKTEAARPKQIRISGGTGASTGNVIEGQQVQHQQVEAPKQKAKA